MNHLLSLAYTLCQPHTLLSWIAIDYEIYHIFIWELFICVITFLRHIQDYKTINAIATNTFFLTDSCLDRDIHAKNYCAFYHHSRIIEEGYKLTTVNKSKFTLLGHTICTNRERLPIYSSEALAEADLFLYQIKNALPLTNNEEWPSPYWFPTLYVYAKSSPVEWQKMRSRKFCGKMYDLFNVKTVDELKTAVSNCEYDHDIRYKGSFEAAPTILTCIKLEEIGALN